MFSITIDFIAMVQFKILAFLGSFRSKIRYVWHFSVDISWQPYIHPEVVWMHNELCLCMKLFMRVFCLV